MCRLRSRRGVDAGGVGEGVVDVGAVTGVGEEGGDRRKSCDDLFVELGWAGGNRQSETSIARRSLC